MGCQTAFYKKEDVENICLSCGINHTQSHPETDTHTDRESHWVAVETQSSYENTNELTYRVAVCVEGEGEKNLCR